MMKSTNRRSNEKIRAIATNALINNRRALMIAVAVFLATPLGFWIIKTVRLRTSPPGLASNPAETSQDKGAKSYRHSVASFTPECESKVSALEQQALESTGLLTKQSLLETHPQLFRRNNEALEIGPPEKYIYRFEDKKGDTFETFIQYEPWAYWEDLGLAIIHYNLYEGDGYTLLDMKGGELHLAALPFFSPSRKYFAVISPAEEAAYNWSGVQIYAVEDGKFIKAYEADKDASNSLSFLRWDSEDQVAVIETITDTTTRQRTYKQSKLVHQGAQWILESGDWFPECLPNDKH